MLKQDLAVRRVRDWTLQQELGRGNYSVVYGAADGNGRNVAIKWIPLIRGPQEEMTGSQMAAILQKKNDYRREIGILQQLKGEHGILRIEDHFEEPREDGGTDLFIVMERLTPLPEHIRKNGMRFADVLELGMSMCKALDILQRHDIVHMDIKPDNIFVNRDGEYILGDFGIACRLDSDFSEWGVGSPRYMSPEAYRGEECDTRSDIYSLGLILYELFNGDVMPFMASKNAVDSEYKKAYERRVQGEPLPVPSLLTDDYIRLWDVVEKAVSYDRDQRYDEPGEMEYALRQFTKMPGTDRVITEPRTDWNGEDRAPAQSSYAAGLSDTTPRNYGEGGHEPPLPPPPPKGDDTPPKKRWLLLLPAGAAIIALALIIIYFVNAGSLKASVINNADGSITVKLSGGTPPYTLTLHGEDGTQAGINAQENTARLKDLKPGAIYEIDVRDTGNRSFRLNVTGPSPLPVISNIYIFSCRRPEADTMDLNRPGKSTRVENNTLNLRAGPVESQPFRYYVTILLEPSDKENIIDIAVSLTHGGKTVGSLKERRMIEASGEDNRNGMAVRYWLDELLNELYKSSKGWPADGCALDIMINGILIDSLPVEIKPTE